MKKLVLLAAALLSASPVLANGYNDGFTYGYRAANPNGLAPIPGIGGVPEIGQNDFQHGVVDGVNRGSEGGFGLNPYKYANPFDN